MQMTLNRMKTPTCFVNALLLVASAALAGERFPEMPDDRLTPGSTCATPDAHRYPEQVPYCNRDVSGDTKRGIFQTYDEQLGYQTRQMNRADFKIDHLIPLCAGGSNEVSNLWPQHVSIYNLTDGVEQIACQLMAEGKMSQQEAISRILEMKHHPETGPQVEADMRRRLGHR